MEFLYKAGSNDPAFLLSKISIFNFARVNIDIFINIKKEALHASNERTTKT
ncbi:hypothetical protein MS6015_46740 [Klebsiella pneumoniae]|nr:hypothetical protein MS6015_46740 [Klebsiella pneumoniae]